jgi:hypothetical protein
MRGICIGVVILALLAGCSSKPVEIKTRYVIVAPSQSNMEDAQIESPPDPEKYSQLRTFDEKEDVLMKLIVSLTSSLGDVNKRLAAIRESVRDARAIYKGESAQP